MSTAARLAALEKSRGITANYSEFHYTGDGGGKPCHLGHEHCSWNRWPVKTPNGTILVRYMVGMNIDELG